MYFIATITFIILVLFNSKIMQVIKFYTKYVFYLVSVIFFAIIGIPLCLKNPCSTKSMWVFSSFSYPVTKILGITWEIRNANLIVGEEESAIFAMNHQNSLDMIGLLQFWHTCSIRCSIMVKNSLFWFWPIGPAMWLGGSKFVRRSGSVKARESFNAHVSQLFKYKDKLAVFVEGTRNKNPDSLMPFKKGAFIAAIQHQVPIQPVLFSQYYFLDWDSKRFDSGKIIIDILEPIITKGMTLKDTDELIAKTYDLMSRKNIELRNGIQKAIEKKMC